MPLPTHTMSLPLEVEQEATNSLTVRDSAGDIVFEYTYDGDRVPDEARANVEFIVAAVNATEE